MKRLKKLALISASALMLMSASVGTIGTVNGSNNTVLAVKKKKKSHKQGLKLHWYKHTLTKPVNHEITPRAILYSKFSKHHKWYDDGDSAGDNLYPSQSVAFSGYVYIKKHKYYIVGPVKQNKKYLKRALKKDMMINPSFVVARASEVNDFEDDRPIVYTTGNKPMKLYMSDKDDKVVQLEPYNMNVKYMGSYEPSGFVQYLLPHTPFLLRQDYYPEKQNGKTYYAVTVCVDCEIYKDTNSNTPDQFFYIYSRTKAPYKFPQQETQIRKHIKSISTLDDTYSLIFIEKSDLKSNATKGGTYSYGNYYNFKNK